MNIGAAYGVYFIVLLLLQITYCGICLRFAYYVHGENAENKHFD